MSAAHWYEGPLLGNGDIGAVMFSDGDRLALAVGKNDFWDRRQVRFRKRVPFRQCMIAASEGRIEDTVHEVEPPEWADQPPKEQESYTHPKPVCRIELSQRLVGAASGIAPVEHELTLVDATLRTSAAGMRTCARVQRDANVMVLHVEPVAGPVTVRLIRYPDSTATGIAAPVHEVIDDLALLEQEMPAERTYPGGFRCAVATKIDGLTPVCAGDSITWQLDRPATLFLAVATTGDAANPRDRARGVLAAAVGEGDAAMFERHAAEWHAFWNRSWVRVDHEQAQTLWHLHNYLIACATRPGATPPGLFGPWTVHDTSAWHGHYTTDYNFEQTYAAVLSCNHPELLEPYLEFVDQLRPAARAFALEIFEADGLAFPHALAPIDMTGVGGAGTAYICESPFLVQHFWEHYLHTLDENRLRRQGYPMLAGAADFLADYATALGDGRYAFFPTRSCEHHQLEAGLPFHRNGIAELAMSRYVLSAAIEAAQLIGEADAARPARWEALLRGLPSFPHYATQVGEVFVDADATPIDRNYAAPPPLPLSPDHRRYSAERRISKQPGNDGAWMAYNCHTVLWPVWPGEQIDADSPPEELLVAIRTFMHTRNEGANDLIARYVAAARLGLPLLDALMGDTAERLLANGSISCIAHAKAYRHDPAMADMCRPFGVYVENFAFPLVINEMMLQSQHGVIRLFPAFDPYLTAEFHQLRARGGFLVSAAVDRGFVTWASIEATTTRHCRVRAFGPPHRICVTQASTNCDVAVRVEHRDIVFHASAGETYRLQCI